MTPAKKLETMTSLARFAEKLSMARDMYSLRGLSIVCIISIYGLAAVNAVEI